MQSKRPAVLLFKRRTSTPLMKMGRYFLDARSRFWFWTEFSLGCRRIILFKNDTYKTSGTWSMTTFDSREVPIHRAFSYDIFLRIPKIYLEGVLMYVYVQFPSLDHDKLMIFSLGGDLTFTTCWRIRISTYLI